MGLRKKKTLLDQAEEYVEAAMDQAKDFVQDTAKPAWSDAREKATPIVAAGAAGLAEKAGAAQEYADAKAAELEGKPKKRSKLKTLLLFGLVAGAVAVIAKKLQGGGGGDDGWQSSYEPTPPPGTSTGESITPPVPGSASPVEQPPTSMADEAAQTDPPAGPTGSAPPIEPIPDAPEVPEPEPEPDPLTDPMPETEPKPKSKS